MVKDLKFAVSWYRKGWEEWGLGITAKLLGDCYYNGEGVTKDLAAARSWYTKGADKENGHSKYRLGLMLFKGEGGRKTTTMDWN